MTEVAGFISETDLIEGGWGLLGSLVCHFATEARIEPAGTLTARRPTSPSLWHSLPVYAHDGDHAVLLDSQVVDWEASDATDIVLWHLDPTQSVTVRADGA